MFATDAAPPAAAPFEPQRYPRTYAIPMSTRIAMLVGAGIMAALAVFIAHATNLAQASSFVPGLGIAVLLAGMAAWLPLAALRTRLVLSPDHLDYRDAWRSRRVAFAHIQGWGHTPNTRRGTTLWLKPIAGLGHKLTLSGDMTRDAWFDAWLARLPDLDDGARRAALAQVLDDKRLGATPQDVEPKLERVITISRVVAFAGLAVGFAGLWAPLRFSTDAFIVAGVCLPALALCAALLWRGLVTLAPSSRPRDVRPAMLGVMLLPIGMTGFRLVSQANLLDLRQLAVPALASGVLGLVLAVWLDEGLRRKAGEAIAVFLFVGAYGGIAFGWIDVWGDVTPVPSVRVVVTGAWPVRSATWTLALGPAPTPNDWHNIRVSHDTFRALHVGDVACLGEHPGLFGLRWGGLQRCSGDPQRSPADAAHHWLAHVARPASQRPLLAQKLVDGDWQSVDAELNGLQKRYEAGEVSEVDLEQAYIPLYNVEPALDAPLADWLAHAPKSYAAHLAMALHTERQIEWLSRAGFDERTSPSFNWKERAAFEQEQLDASNALSSRPMLSLLAQHRLKPGAPAAQADWIARAVAIDPDDIALRRDDLIQHPLCPCHGQLPDDPAMRKLLQPQPSARVRDALQAYRLFERGVDAGNTQRAVDLYMQGLALRPYPQDAYTMHINIAVALIEWKRLDEAIAQLKAAIATLPGNRHAHEELGYVYELQKKMPEALAEFLVDAERGQSWAQMRAGSFMLTPEAGVPLDRRNGARWMREAANAGEAQARDILRRHPDLMAEYPPAD